MPPPGAPERVKVPPLNLKELIQFDEQRYVSKMVHDSEKVRVVLFCLKEGQEVLPHTSTSELVLFVAEGRGKAVLGESQLDIERNSVVVCPPEVPHGFKAEEDLVVLAVIAPRP